MMLAGSLMAYVRSMHKVALRAALTPLLSALFVISYVGRLPIADRDRLAWLALSAIFSMLLAIAGLGAIALGQVDAWPLHALSALAGMAYLGAISVALWSRYSYLIELREGMAHGPSYDPVTRMRSHAETGQLVGAVFGPGEGQPRPVGVIAISIGNLYALEQLHGRGAVNHALFVCASRLRRGVPGDVEMGRLGDDGFPWVAEVGVGVLAAATAAMCPAAAVSMARAVSRTAWSFGSRIAWFDRDQRAITELPLADAR